KREPRCCSRCRRRRPPSHYHPTERRHASSRMVKKPLRLRCRSKGGAAKSWAHFDVPPKGGVKAKSIASALVWRAYCSHNPATACVIASPRQLPRRRRPGDECRDCADRRRRPCGFVPALRCREDLAAVRAHPRGG